MSPLVLAGEQPGGQLTTTTEVENYPGFPEGVMGPELMMKMQEQATKCGARVEYKSVSSVEKDGAIFKVKAGEDVIESKTVIVATGAAPRHLGIEGEQELIGHGLTSCATCDGAFYRDVPVAVIGGGDSACEEATFLTKFATKVTMVHRRDSFRASKIMADRALANEKIEVKWFTELVGYHGDADGRIEAVDLKNSQTGEVERYPCGGVFMAIGHVPNTKFLGTVQSPAAPIACSAISSPCANPVL